MQQWVATAAPVFVTKRSDATVWLARLRCLSHNVCRFRGRLHNDPTCADGKFRRFSQRIEAPGPRGAGPAGPCQSHARSPRL